MNKYLLARRNLFILIPLSVFVFFSLIYTIQTGCYFPEKEDGIRFEKAIVVSVDQEDLSRNIYRQDAYTGSQQVTVVIKSGNEQGKKLSLENILDTNCYIYLKKGDPVVLRITEQDSEPPEYVIQQYDRLPFLGIMVLIFFLFLILIGKKKGLLTIGSLLFDLYTMIFFTLPLIYHGVSPVATGIFTVTLMTAATLYFLNGLSKKTAAAFLASMLGICFSGIIFFIFSKMLHISGYNIEEIDILLPLVKTRGLKISSLLFAGALISSSGAVMDVGLSITSALAEMKIINPELSFKKLFLSGIHIGQDMTGTMCNTLILAYAGTSFTMMLEIAAFNMSYLEIITLDYIAIELLMGFSGTLAVVFTVPFASIIAAGFFQKRITAPLN